MTKRSRSILTLARAIDRFLVELEDAKGATPDTLKAYRWTLERMGGVLGWDRDPLSITSDDLLDVLGAWRKLSTSSRANRVSVMRTFFAWMAERYDVFNPAANLHRPTKQRKARKRLTSDDVYSLMRACESDRDKVVVYLLAMTGMRRGDLRRMQWKDVDFKQRMLVIPLGKGRKGRSVPLPPPLVSLLRDVAGRLQEAGEYHPDYYVSPRTVDHAMPTGGHAHKVYHDKMQGEAAAYKLLHRLALKADVALPLSPHDLRRYYAGFFLETNPGDLFRLQAVMGHADIGTTRMYLPDADMPRVQEAVDRMEWTVPVDASETVENES